MENLQFFQFYIIQCKQELFEDILREYLKRKEREEYRKSFINKKQGKFNKLTWGLFGSNNLTE